MQKTYRADINTYINQQKNRNAKSYVNNASELINVKIYDLQWPEKPKIGQTLVIAWGRGQLNIYSLQMFKFLT